MNISDEQLISCAKEARAFAYAPYSHFTVGAALLCEDGTVIKGCNVENASYGATNCAERTAFFKAVSEGKKDFEAIAIVGGRDDKEADTTCPPCGVCRQVMREFCNENTFRIVLLGAGGEPFSVTLKELLPLSFGPESI